LEQAYGNRENKFFGQPGLPFAISPARRRYTDHVDLEKPRPD